MQIFIKLFLMFGSCGGWSAFWNAAKDKTVIFISHRLSTTHMADIIYTLKNGQVTESGSHDELMAQNEKYTRMFRMQASKYLEEREG